MNGKRCGRWICLAMAIAMLAGAVVPCAAESRTEIVSHGLAVLAARTNVAVSAQIGNDAVFSGEIFCRGMNLSSISGVTIVSLPSVADGQLLLGSSALAAGQTVPAEALDAMVFHPAAETVKRADFQFSVNGSAVPMLCTVYLLEELNYTPTVSVASGLSLRVKTHKGLSAYGTLMAYDPDGDDVAFEIISYPKNGTLRITDATRGSYVYSPYANYVGSDAFTYVVRDVYGNYSASATVSLTVDRAGTSITYADMETSPSYNAALTVTEQGIMSGVQVGREYYFYPEKTVSRIELLVMAMNAVGIREVPDCIATPYADDSDIPASMKGYVAAARELGLIEGREGENGELYLDPNESITRAQAAVMLAALLEPESVQSLLVFEDHSEIPVWAADAIYTLNAVGILPSSDGVIAAGSLLSRGQAAEILAAVMAYLNVI